MLGRMFGLDIVEVNGDLTAKQICYINRKLSDVILFVASQQIGVLTDLCLCDKALQS